MRALLIHPLFPRTFWSYEKILELVGRKVLLPPLGLLTVAAILPQTWEFKLVDRNIRSVAEDEWTWADLVLLSGMVVQKEDLLNLIHEAKRRKKAVVAGGAYPTSMPEEVLAAGVDFLVMDEGEITIPLFLEALAQGEVSGRFTANGLKPDISTSPVPRYDLLELQAYDSMAIQFSRGCPFQCEFCDVIALYGRKSRTKLPGQILAELDYLHRLGWRGSFLMVDDNFIGNRTRVKQLLRELRGWQRQHNYPFNFDTEATIDLANDDDLLALMLQCNFKAVFIGIETPDEKVLHHAKKYQNLGSSLTEAVDKLTRAGLRVMAGLIIGFDGEESGAGQRVVDFVEASAIPTAFLTMLQAMPHTALWQRLEHEGRLCRDEMDLNQSTLINFIPTRPIVEIAQEYLNAFCQLYDPIRYLDRVYRYFLKLGPPTVRMPIKRPEWVVIHALAVVFWRQGIERKTRWKFWRHLIDLLMKNPQVVEQYVIICAQNEHFLEFRGIVKEQIEAQLLRRI
jgi:radical SAM superfamily enzyme YgiQ (UPF0313 family)